MGGIKKVLRNLSIKKTFMLYMLLFMLLAVLLSTISINIADHVKNEINLSYADSENKFALKNNKGDVAIAIPPANYTPKDKAVISICSIVDVWSIPIFFGLCIILSAALFYESKLKKPIAILNTASQKIAGSDLDFHIFYDSTDEMGRLCSSFETMRSSLYENNKTMWRSIEERKRMNAAFSHDLRTPITVLRGYTDFLKEYLPQGKISEEKLNEIISAMSGNIERLENYVQMMSEVQRLTDINVSMQNVNLTSFLEQLKNSAEILMQHTELKMKFAYEPASQDICMDASIVSRVFDNLISNAEEYAESTISIECRYLDGEFTINVADDGKGFTDEALLQAAKPYYRNHSSSDKSHLGLGLYICSILCKKHGGNLLIENGKNGGASVTANFLSDMKNTDKS